MDVLDRADLPFPHSLPEFQRLFPDDAACAAYLEKARWGDGFASVPVQIWSGSLDDRVPHETNVAPLAKQLPRPAEVQVVDQAGHFAFLRPCNPATEDANPRWNMLCVDTPGFDRTAFHDIMNAGIIAFFDRTLKN